MQEIRIEAKPLDWVSSNCAPFSVFLFVKFELSLEIKARNGGETGVLED